MAQQAATLLEIMTDQFSRVQARLDRLLEGIGQLAARGAASDGVAAEIRVELAEVNARLERIHLRLDRLERPTSTFPSA
jgi:hypothetical protein